MALFTPGNTCNLCKLPMEKRKEVIIFPHLVSNAHDPLATFSSGVFHKTCVRSHPWGTAAIRQKQYVHETILPTTKKECALCGEIISDLNLLISTGLLTARPKHALYRYNWLQAHKRCLSHWEELPILVNELTKFAQNGKWADFNPEYRVLEKLLETITALHPGRANARL